MSHKNLQKNNDGGQQKGGSVKISIEPDHEKWKVRIWVDDRLYDFGAHGAEVATKYALKFMNSCDEVTTKRKLAFEKFFEGVKQMCEDAQQQTDI